MRARAWWWTLVLLCLSAHGQPASQPAGRSGPSTQAVDAQASLAERLEQAEALAARGRKGDSLAALAQASALVESAGGVEREIALHETAARVHERLGDPRRAFEHLSELRKVEKKRSAEANAKLTSELQSRFEVQKKSSENALLHAQQAEAQAQRRALLLALGLAILLPAGLAWLIAGHQRHKRRMAEEADAAKSRFLAAASHDMRQPVHALNLYLGTMAGLELPPQAQILLGNARRCGQSMDEMFRALLDLSRLNAAALPVEIAPFPLEPMLLGIRALAEPQARAAGLVLRVHVCRAWAASDSKLVERILMVFVSNAVRYTKQGRVLVGCRRRPGGVLRLAVYDTGPGIAAERHEAIFEEFGRLGEAAQDRSEGLGLGLAIAKRLAALIRAPMVLRSRPGKGSMFAIDLPQADAAVVPADAPQAPVRDALQGALVVVVDDEAPIRQAMSVLLRQWGCEVLAAADARQTAAQLGRYRRVPALLICDYRLGGTETGVDVVRSLRSEFNHEIPALLITGDTAPEPLREVARSGLAVLHKPVAAEELREVAERLVAAGSGQEHLDGEP